MSLKHATTSTLTGLFLLLSSPLLWALTGDRGEPIYISSDQAERDEKQGITIYTGSVQMDQGSLRINADKVVVHSPNNQVSQIIATGKPAHYQQKPAPEKPLVIAKGDTIKYFLLDEQIHLISNASLTQSDGTTMTGDTIDYNIKDSLVKAQGASNQPGNDRIHMVIPAKKN